MDIKRPIRNLLSSVAGKLLQRKPSAESMGGADRCTPSPAPLPAGWSEEELRELVTTILVEGGPSDELTNYGRIDFKRFIQTLALVPDTPGLTLLELGANPYFTTTLLYKFRNVKLHLANFFGGPERQGVQRVTVRKTGEVILYTYKCFNIEHDQFPYEDGSFDILLFCEILEHLLSDPVHALIEIRRVLKDGGLLVLSTPNVAGLGNVGKLIAGQNIYEPYSGYGPYGRHNREYTRDELFRLLSANGFQVKTLFTADVRNNLSHPPIALDVIRPLVECRGPDLGEFIFCQSIVNQNAKWLPPIRPEWLYRSLHSKCP